MQQLLGYVSGWMNLDDRGGAPEHRREASGTSLTDALTGSEREAHRDADGVIRVSWSSNEEQAFARKVAACLDRTAARYFHDCNFLD